MKSIHNWIVVFFRVAALCVALYGLFSTIATGLALLSFFPANLDGIATHSDRPPSLISLSVRMLLLYLASAATLWLVSRPAARLIVRDLKDD